ncbi:MAG: Xaa-Pro aminopeptidase [Pseudomonadota bacterium]|nr:Xaa-Pro aminopeptidase [Pseudomonadota bacterium]
MTAIKEKLSQLRTLMSDHQIDLYIVPSTDPHCNEYLPECWKRRAWISDFTGSAGEVLVAQNHAYLSTDGRYFLQAEQQLDAQEYTLLRQNSFYPETEAWLQQHALNKTLGIDPRLIGINRAKRLQQILNDNGGQLKLIEVNLIDQCRVANNENISLPCSQAFILSEQYSGVSSATKISWLQQELREHNADYIVLNALDEIAWLFNLRGFDIDYNPLIISYAIIGTDTARLFVNLSSISDQVNNYLQPVKLHQYEDFGSVLESLSGVIWLDDKIASYWILNKINSKNQIKLASSPIVHQKACKNVIESEGARIAHVKDAVALISFLSWLHTNWQSGIDELTCIDKLAQFREKNRNFLGSSFATISGFAANSAVIHYSATQETNKIIDDSNMYLLDSGGQYLEGTTDITRTIHLGTASKQQKRHYTLVLKGHLALGRAIFNRSTCGEHLDILARAPLWSDYLDYRHGTGHGVGSCLCVHEGPQKISQMNSGVPLKGGMIVSNEPGVYLSGQYGIRIENLCLVVIDESKAAQASEYGPFYKFETLSLVPYCSELIDVSMLTSEEIAQICEYYQLIKLKVSNLLDSSAQAWLDSELSLFIQVHEERFIRYNTVQD